MEPEFNIAASPQGSPMGADDGIDLMRMPQLVAAKRWLVMAGSFVAVMLAAVYVTISPKIYQARALVQIESKEQQLLRISQAASQDFGTLEVLKTIETAFGSSTLLLRVARQTGLDKIEGFGVKDGQPCPDEKLAQNMAKVFKVKLQRGTRLIEITAESQIPEQAKALAEALVNGFLEENFEQRASMTRKANGFLLKEADRLKLKLQKSDQDLQAYKEQHQAVSLEDGQNIIVSILKDVTTRATQAQAERLKLESDLALVEELGDAAPEELLKVQSISALNPEITQIHTALVSAQTSFEVLKTRYLPKHPKYIATEKEVASLQRSFKAAVQHAVAKLHQIYDSARETEERMDEARKEQEKAALDLNSLSIPFNVLQREVEADQVLYDAVLARLKETSVADSIDASPVRLVDQPVLPITPIKPKKMQILALAFIAGAGLVIAWIIAADLLSASFRGVEDVELSLGLTVRAVVAKLKPVKGSNPAIVDGKENSSVAESFRVLRASLTLLSSGAVKRSILVTSASPGEGKSFCSANLAGAYAQQGLTTLLIDADLRRPVLGTRFGIHGIGLTDLLRGKAAVEEAVHPTDIEGLSLIPAGTYCDSPSELLANGKFSLLLKELLARFDRVIVDSAPVNVVSDTLPVAGLVDTTCLVIRAGKTHRSAAKRAKQLLEMAGAHIAGVVWNQADTSSPGGSNQYYYYHNHEYSAAPVEAA